MEGSGFGVLLTSPPWRGSSRLTPVDVIVIVRALASEPREEVGDLPRFLQGHGSSNSLCAWADLAFGVDPTPSLLSAHGRPAHTHI